MNNRPSSYALLTSLALASGIAVLSSAAHCAVIEWGANADGIFSDDSSWKDDSAPSPSSPYDDVLFNVGSGTYEVSLTSDATTASTEVRTDAVTFSLSANGYTTGTTKVGTEVGATGSLTISGTGMWTNSDSVGEAVDIGTVGTGSVTVQNGAVVSNQASTRLGDFATGEGTLTITGDGTSWTSSAGFNIGKAGEGRLLIQDQATLVSGGGAILGGDATAIGTVRVDTGASWTASGPLEIGAFGEGNLTVASGGQLNSLSGLIAASFPGGPSSHGTVEVTGVGSQWITTANLVVGAYGGAAELTVRDHGLVSVGSMLRGDGKITVSNAQIGTASSFTLSKQGSLSIDSGGQVLVDSTATFGGATSSGITPGTVRVTGPGSLLTAIGSLSLANANLSVLAGAQVSSGRWVSSGSADETSVSVDGAGSTITVAGDALLGYLEREDIRVTDGAKFSIGGDVNAAPFDFASLGNELKLLVDGTGSRLEVGGVFDMGGIIYSATGASAGGKATLTISNGGAVEIGESLRIWDGSLVDNQGTVNIGDGPAPTTSATTRIGDGGSLFGTGRITGSVLEEGGLAAPGFSIGTLTIDGGYTLTGTGVLELEIGGTTLYDRLVVSGDVLLNGILRLVFVDGYLPELDDLIEGLIIVGADSIIEFGDDFTTRISGIAPGWEYALLVEDGALILQSNADAEAVPVPAPWLLIAAGLAVLSYQRRRLASA